jgi:hypothetical protein
MDNEEKLHLDASAYADAQAKERHEQRTKNNMPPYDALQETRLWVAAYEGYVAGRMQFPLEPDYWLDASHDDGDIIANDVKMKGEFFTRFHTTPLYMQKEKNHG